MWSIAGLRPATPSQKHGLCCLSRTWSGQTWSWPNLVARCVLQVNFLCPSRCVVMNLGWLLGTLLRASLSSLHGALSPMNAVGVIDFESFCAHLHSCQNCTNMTNNHCLNTACSSTSLPIFISMLLLNVRTIFSTFLLLCSAPLFELLSPFGDCSKIVSLSRLPLIIFIARCSICFSRHHFS